MECLLANRRKWFQAEPEPEPNVPASVWANFNLAKATHVGSAQLTAANSSGTSKTMNVHNIGAMPDGRLLLSANSHNYVYVWGFEDGHPFEVAHFKDTYDSRAYCGVSCAQFSDDGMNLYRSAAGESTPYRWELSEAYDLNATVGTSPTSGSNAGISGTLRVFRFAPGGKRLIYKDYWGSSAATSSYLYVRDCPNDFAENMDAGDFTLRRVLLSKFNETIAGSALASSSSLMWGSFCFSPDGLAVVFVIGGNATDNSTTKRKYAVKFVLTEAWNPLTLVYHSKVYLGDDMGVSCIPQAVAVNGDGTKMLVFDASTSTGGYSFHEYNLS